MRHFKQSEKSITIKKKANCSKAIRVEWKRTMHESDAGDKHSIKQAPHTY